MDFDINESLKLYLSDPASIQTPDAAPEIADTDSDGLDQSAVVNVLEPIRDSIHDHPDALARGPSFDTLQCLLKYVPTLSLHLAGGRPKLTLLDMLPQYQALYSARSWR